MNKKGSSVFSLIAFLVFINIIFGLFTDGGDLFDSIPSFFTIVILFSIITRLFQKWGKPSERGDEPTTSGFTASFFDDVKENKPQHECEYCGHMNDLDREYCENCGARQLDVDQKK